MKKTFTLFSLVAVTAVLLAGCGKPAGTVTEEDIEGADWRTTRAFTSLEWNTPDGKTDLLAAAYEADGVIILAPDQEDYAPFPDCALLDGIHDIKTVEDSMYMMDFNEDGYDDFCVDDLIDGEIESEVFLYNPESASFDYSDEYSSAGGYLKEVEDADLSKFAGDWYVDGSLENGHLSISEDGHVESYSYDGMFNFEGELVCEEYENPDGTTGYLYSIYDDGGEFVTGFYEPEEDDFYELYTGQDGEVRYVRSDHCTGDANSDADADGWKAYYGSLIQNWEKDHEKDYIHGYKLFYLNDDEIPEIALIGGEEWALCEIHSYVDETAIKVYSADDLNTDGNGLCYYEKSGFLVPTKWNAGIGTYEFYDVMSADPDTVYCRINVAAEDSLAGKASTDVEFIEPSGDTYSKHYDKEYDLSDLPEKSNIEESLVISDLSDIRRLDNEEDLMDYDQVNEALDSY
ncbi:MAG: hypothetical protein K6D90_05200 [Lachnospiraceae bacterium]|nr:hypothetical protein [Lachnospiraceae bacterium]